MIAFALGAVVGLVGALVLAALVTIACSAEADEALAVIDVPDDETPIPLLPDPPAVLDRHGRIVQLGGAS